MVGRVTANVVLGVVSLGCAAEANSHASSWGWRGGGGKRGGVENPFSLHRRQREHEQQQQQQSNKNACWQATAPTTTNEFVLDLSNFLAQESAVPIRINHGGHEQEWHTPRQPQRHRPRTSSSRSAVLTASVRTRRRKQVDTAPAAEPIVEDEEEDFDPEFLQAITQPFVPKSMWSRVKGKEFDQPNVVDKLVETGLLMASSENEWIEWKARQQPKKQQQPQDSVPDMDGMDMGQVGADDDNDNDNDDMDSIAVYVGKCKKKNTDEYYGANLPMVKTQAVIGMSPKELADLLLDSSRVRIYNKMSVGRTDVRTLPSPEGTTTKIVSNLTQPPIGKKKIMSTTLMHARPLNEQGTSYLVVSRAVPLKNEKEDDEEEHGKSEILLGVNLLEQTSFSDPSSCRATCITHVYAPQLPAVLAKGVGVKSAINFINDIRSVCSKQ